MRGTGVYRLTDDEVSPFSANGAAFGRMVCHGRSPRQAL